MSSSASVSISSEGKVEIDLPRAFKVRRPVLGVLGMPQSGLLTEEIVWAHSCSPIEGALVFSTYKAKLVKVMDATTHVVTEQEYALQTFNVCMAPGTWYDVTEQVMVPAKPNALAN